MGSCYQPRTGPAEPPAPPLTMPPDELRLVRSLADALSDTVAGLDAYIERRAAEVAAPAIAEALHRAAHATAAVEDGIESSARRLSDLQREHAKQIAALERRIEGYKAELDALRARRGNADA